MSKAASIRRILVAVDASPASLAALEAAAHVAATLGAELSGLYIEDEALIRSAELPSSRVVGSFSGVVRPIERREIEHQLRSQARRVRQALESAAVRARVRWSFSVHRGGVTSVLAAACGEADLISLGRRSRTPGSQRLGHTSATILESRGAPVLLLDQGLRPGRAVVAIYDGGPGAPTALGLARLLTGDGQTPLVVVLRGSDSHLDELEATATGELKDLGIERGVQFFRLGTGDTGQLTRLSQAGGIGVLILPRRDALAKSVSTLLTELRCPVLVVREPAEA